MDNVHAINTNFAGAVAGGLESLAAQIRAGEIDARRAFVILTTVGDGEDLIGGQMFGAGMSRAELVGTLELMKCQAIRDA